MKQRQTSYIMNNNQRINSNQRDYFNNQPIGRTDSSYDIIQEQEQKLRLIILKIY
jgi:hypothetical protein